MCLYPKLIKNRKYIANKKNGGKAPVLHDKRLEYVAVGCQNCLECRKQKAREWQVRLLEEIKDNKDGQFVTLTLSDESVKELAEGIFNISGYDLDNAIITKAVGRFLGRWRKEYKTSVRHWLISELGHNGTENIHLHGIIFSKNKEAIKRHWQYGFVFIGDYVSERTVNYIIKYVTKIDEKHKYYKPKILTSKGMGSKYTERYNAKLNKYNSNGQTKDFYITRTGHKLKLPIYYRNKIYSEEEREKLWQELLDKEERWIMGNKIDISTPEGYEKYFKLLKVFQQKNKRLGYGDDEINWEKKRYENDLRNLKIKERIRRAENNNNNKKKKKGNSH